MYLNNFQLAEAIVKTHTARKFRNCLKLADGTRLNEIKNFTHAEYELFGQGEDYTDKEAEALVEKGGWIILDAFSASAIVQTYNALKPDNQAKFLRFSISRILDITWKHCK